MFCSNTRLHSNASHWHMTKKGIYLIKHPSVLYIWMYCAHEMYKTGFCPEFKSSYGTDSFSPSFTFQAEPIKTICLRQNTATAMLCNTTVSAPLFQKFLLKEFVIQAVSFSWLFLQLIIQPKCIVPVALLIWNLTDTVPRSFSFRCSDWVTAHLIGFDSVCLRQALSISFTKACLILVRGQLWTLSRLVTLSIQNNDSGCSKQYLEVARSY